MPDANASRKVVVIGQGYVGLPLAVRAVEVGFDVVGFEVDHQKVELLRAGRSFIDDLTDAQIANCVDSNRYLATAAPSDIDDFDVAVITVPTPLRHGAPDLSYIHAAIELLGPRVTVGCTVVLESTTYPGTTREVLVPRLDELSGLSAGDDYHVGYSPERIDPGNETWDLRRTPKVVAGHTPSSLAAVTAFYDQIVETTVPVSTTDAAELTKLLENTFRHVNIALVNEIAVLSRGLGIDIWEVVTAAESKPFGFTTFWPGPGVGGHCLPIDPSYLAWKFSSQLGTTSRFIEIANDINNGMPPYVVRRVQDALNDVELPVRGANILIVGLAYKRNSGDARETPAIGVIQGLLALGAEVTVHDDWAPPANIDAEAPRVKLTSDAVRAADVVVIVTDHDDIDYTMIAENATLIFDTRNRMESGQVRKL